MKLLLLALIFFILSTNEMAVAKRFGKRRPQKHNPCAPIVCQNGGFCEKLGNVGYCACLPSFTGSACEIKLDFYNPCANISCQNVTKIKIKPMNSINSQIGVFDSSFL
jgi:hypothetical protein